MKRLAFFLLILSSCTAAKDDEVETPVPPEKPAATAENTPKVTEEREVRPKLDAPLERRLFPQSYTASSHLENDWNKFQENYLAIYMGDDNPVTGWTEGKEDVGLGETITVEHTPLDDATKLRLEIRNGYQKSERLFGRNARAKDITLTLLPSGATSKHTLEDKQGWQTITAEQPQGALKGYTIQFDSVYKGSHYEDLVISDIQTYVTALTPDNPTFETSKQKKTLDWIAGRVEAAKTFKEAAKGSIPVAPDYKIVKEGGFAKEECYDESNCPLPFKRAIKIWGDEGNRIRDLGNAAEETFAGWKQVKIASDDKRKIPQADDFFFPGSWAGDILIYEGDYAAINIPTPRLLGYFNSNNLKRVFVEGKGVTPEAAVKGTAPGCSSKDGDKHYFFTPDVEGPLRTLLIASCGMYEDREGYTSGEYWQVLAYGDDGQLDKLFDFYSGYDYQWTKKDGAPFLSKVQRVSSGGAKDTTFAAQ